MSIRSALLAAALLAAPLAAHAQTAPATPAPAPAPAEDPAEAALEAKGEAFGETMQTMAGEMQAAITAAGGDTARANTSLDAIVGRYQPQADAFADEIQAFLDAKLTTMPEGEEKASLAAGLPMAIAAVRGAPAMVRGQIQAAAAARQAAPAAPQ